MPSARVLASAVLAAALVAAGSLLAPSSSAQVTGYRGTASAELVRLRAVNVTGVIQLADLVLAPAEVEVASTGLVHGNARARAANLDVDLVSQTVDESLLVAVEHLAPGGVQGPVVQTLLEVPGAPVIDARVTSASAHSRWADGGCIAPGTPVSEATTEILGADLLSGTPAGDALLSVGNPDHGAVFTQTAVDLFDVPGQPTKGVRSVARTQLTGFTLFEGTENQLTVNVLAPLELVAQSTGQPGGASVTYTHPVLQVVDATGEILGEIDAAEGDLELDASPVAVLRLGQLSSEASESGTLAYGSAVMLEVILGADADLLIDPGARITIAGADVNASAPVGGVRCEGLGPEATSPSAGTDGGSSTGGDAAGDPAVLGGGVTLPATGTDVLRLLALAAALLAAGAVAERGAGAVPRGRR